MISWKNIDLSALNLRVTSVLASNTRNFILSFCLKKRDHFDIAKEGLLGIGEKIHREKYRFKIQEGFSLDNYDLPERIFETPSLVGKIDKNFVDKVVKYAKNEIFK